jgi:hypothetical protein
MWSWLKAAGRITHLTGDDFNLFALLLSHLSSWSYL